MKEIIKQWTDLFNGAVKGAVIQVLKSQAKSNEGIPLYANQDFVAFIADTIKDVINLSVDTKDAIEIEKEARQKARQLQRELKEAERDQRVLELMQAQGVDIPAIQKEAKTKKGKRKKQIDELEEEQLGAEIE